jgi:tRNA uridine 5-carbamoylmethylation protein Kti12
VEKGSPGSGKVTTLHQLRQSKNDENFTTNKSLQEREIKLLSTEELPQILKDVFSHSNGR